MNEIYNNIEYIYAILLILVFVFMMCRTENRFERLLEFPKKYYFGKESLIIGENILKSELRKFCDKLDSDYNFIVSLSGGVDSMVTLALLYSIVSKDKIVTASVNYNQRNESTEEINFLKDYLKTYDIKNYSVTVNVGKRKSGNIKRKVFEETSQKIRYELYRDIIRKNKWTHDKTIILLGHHNDDLIENIFNNFMSGRSLTDLEVMRDLVVKDKLIFGRPFLKYPKSVIYDVSHNNKIPYFKDTTPNWSKRGLMRRKLFPLLKKIYPNLVNSLKKQGEVSSDLNVLISSNFVNDFITGIKEEDLGDKIVLSWSNKLNSSSKIVWKERLSKMLHSRGIGMISSKSIDIFIERENCKKYNILSKYVSFKRTKDETFLSIKKK